MVAAPTSDEVALGSLLRPAVGRHVAADLAPRVVAPAYDRVTAAERRARRSGSDLTFLHVLPSEAGPGEVSRADLTHARAALARLQEAAFPGPDRPFVAAYRLVEDGHEQTGLVADVDVGAVGVVIHGHERTHPSRVDDLCDYLQIVGVQSSAVALAHSPDERLAAALAEVTAAPATVSVPESDGVTQDLWVVTEADRMRALLAAASGITDAVIADGHHRSAAAQRHARGRTGAATRLLVALFPSDRLHVGAFHRVVRPPIDLPPSDVPAALRSRGFVVRALDRPEPPSGRHEFAALAAGRWFLVRHPADRLPDDPVDATDAWLLQHRVLAPLFDVDDPARDERLLPVPAASGLGALADLVGSDGVGFALPPPSAEELLVAGRSGRVLPPKSTHVHPKVRSGLLIVPRG